MRVRPISAFAVVLLLLAGGVLADYLFEGGLRRDYIRVSPDAAGMVKLTTADLAPGEIRFYRFLNPGNQEVRFFVARDAQGVLQVAFDGSENHAKVGRGFRLEGDWVVDNKCDTPTRLTRVNEGLGGCSPVPLQNRLEGDLLILAEADILKGWRLFH